MHVPLDSRVAVVAGPLAAHWRILLFLRSSSPVVLPFIGGVDGRRLLGRHSDFGCNDFIAPKAIFGGKRGHQYVHAVRG